MAIRILHQRLIHQRRLRVEYAKPEQIRRLPAHTVCDYALKRYHNLIIVKYIIIIYVLINRKIKQDQINAFREKINQLKLIKSKYLLESYDQKNSNFNFPKITQEILDRINNHLFNNEQFYFHVLLLMIHLGLDSPFDKSKIHDDNSLTTIPIPANDDSESELETILDSNDLSQLPELEWKCRKRKKLKTGLLGEIVESTKTTNKIKNPTILIEEIFDKNMHVSKNQEKLLINIPSSLENKSSSNSEIDTLNGFGLLKRFEPKSDLTPPIRSDNYDICFLTKQSLITDEELSTSKISEIEWPKYSVFKNYSSGTISHRLYVKNIHRRVKLKDLYRLFAKYIDLDDDQQMNKFVFCLFLKFFLILKFLNSFGIVYLEKGKMRGQAFVTYPEECQAQKALESVNGYVFFDDKPIVVSFARTNKTLK